MMSRFMENEIIYEEDEDEEEETKFSVCEEISINFFLKSVNENSE